MIKKLSSNTKDDLQLIKRRPTPRALDAGESARFTSSFLASSLYSFQAESTPAPAPVTQTVRRSLGDRNNFQNLFRAVDSSSSSITNKQEIRKDKMKDGNERKLFPNRLQLVSLIIVSLCFVAISVWMILDSKIIGLLVTVFFGFGVIVFSLSLIPSSNYLHLYYEGFTICSIFIKYSYKWSDVEPFTIISQFGLRQIVVFRYTDQYKTSEKLDSASKAISSSQFSLPDSYNLPLVELVSLMNDFRSRHKSA